MRRIAVVCPGRGSYARAELGTLTRAHPLRPRREELLERADRWRASIGRPSLRDLDRRPRFGAEHLEGPNAAALIYTASAIDAASLRADLEVLEPAPDRPVGREQGLHPVAGAGRHVMPFAGMA